MVKYLLITHYSLLITHYSLLKNAYCRQEWKKWQTFTESLFYFDHGVLEKIMCLKKKKKIASKA